MSKEKRKLYLFMSTSIDGFFEDRTMIYPWHNVDNEFNHLPSINLSEPNCFLPENISADGIVPAKGSRRYDPVAGQHRNRASDEQHPEIWCPQGHSTMSLKPRIGEM